MDRIDELVVFVAIMETGSLAGAARRLRRSAPAVTRTLALLEDRVGARLIERTTRRLAPTEAGRALAEQARTILADYEAAMAGAAEAPVRGLLHVTAPVQFGRRHVAPLVASFLDSHDQIQIELTLSDRVVDLIEEGADVAVRIGHLEDSTLRARRVGSVRRVVVASPAYLARHGAPARPADLPHHATITSTARAGTGREWRFGPSTRGPVVRLEPRLLVDDIEARLLAVRAGRGIARVLSYQVADELAAGTLVRLLQDFEPPPLPVHLVVPSGSHMPPKVRAFLDHAAAGLGALHVIHEEAAS